MKRWSNLFAAAIVVTLLAPQLAVRAADYEMVLLEPPGFGIRSSEGLDINELGDVVGRFDEQEHPHLRRGFFYSSAFDIYWVTDPFFELRGVNNFDEMVGNMTDVEWRGQYWSGPGAEPLDLPPLPGEESGVFGGISDAGLVAGWSWDGVDSLLTPVVWRITATGVFGPLVLPVLPQHVTAVATNVGPSNANGVAVVVGASGPYPGETSVSWKVKGNADGTLVLQDGPVDLGSLGDGDGSAQAVNSNQLIVGSSGSQAFKKTKNGTMKALQRLKVEGVSAPVGVAYDVNDYKDIVGRQSHRGVVSSRNDGLRGVLWVGGKKVVDLNKKVDMHRKDRIEEARAINNAGEIVIFHEDRLGNGRGGILFPIP
jgi:hypothetical protein